VIFERKRKDAKESHGARDCVSAAEVPSRAPWDSSDHRAELLPLSLLWLGRMMMKSCLLVEVGRCRCLIETCTKGDPVPYLT
jgi:hypothetical protein